MPQLEIFGDDPQGSYIEDGLAVEVHIEDKASKFHLKKPNLFVGVGRGTNLLISG